MVRKTLFLCAVAFMGAGSQALAADISLVSGFYKSESSKSEGKSLGSSSLFGFAGRFHDDLSENLSWYGIGGLQLASYSAADGRKSPDNSVSLTVGGGIRHYFKPFGAGVVPYASGGGRVANDRSAKFTTSGYTEINDSGLRYEAAIGVRAGLDESFFAELELPLFDNALFGVRKEVTVVEGPPVTETKKETTYNQLWVDSSGQLLEARIALGYKF